MYMISYSLQIAVTMIEHYPTHLIMKTLPKIDRKRRYLREAYKFIKREKVRATKWTVTFIVWNYFQNQMNRLIFCFSFVCVSFSLDLLAYYQRRNHFDALFVWSKASCEGKWSNVDYYFVTRFTRGFSTGYQTIDIKIFDEVWL